MPPAKATFPVKASPPNWANIASVIISGGIALVATVAFAVRAEMRIQNLEQEVEALARRTSIPTAQGSNRNEDVCRELAKDVSSAITTGFRTDVDALTGLMERMGCVGKIVEEN